MTLPLPVRHRTIHVQSNSKRRKIFTLFPVFRGRGPCVKRITMKFKAILSVVLLSTTMAYGQTDPTIMTINGKPVSRSEFEYSYNKNNADGVIDKKSVDEYVNLFINYKLKGTGCA